WRPPPSPGGGPGSNSTEGHRQSGGSRSTCGQSGGLWTTSPRACCRGRRSERRLVAGERRGSLLHEGVHGLAVVDRRAEDRLAVAFAGERRLQVRARRREQSLLDLAVARRGAGGHAGGQLDG